MVKPGGVNPPRKHEYAKDKGTDRGSRCSSVVILYRLTDPPNSSKLLNVMILPQVHLRKPCYDFYFL